MNMVFCATWNEHSPRKHTKNRCQRWHSGVSCCCYRAPPQAAMPCCCHCCHCLIRGSRGRAGVAACGGSSGSGSGAILFLFVVVILLLFARPLLIGVVLPLLSIAALSAGRRLPAFNAQWLVVVCSYTLPSLLLPAVQRSLMIVSPAAGHRRISSLLCRRRPAPLLPFGRGRTRPCHCHRGWRRGPVRGHEAMAENQLIPQR